MDERLLFLATVRTAWRFCDLMSVAMKGCPALEVDHNFFMLSKNILANMEEDCPPETPPVVSPETVAAFRNLIAAQNASIESNATLTQQLDSLRAAMNPQQPTPRTDDGISFTD